MGKKTKNIKRLGLFILLFIIILLIGTFVYANRMIVLGVETAGTKALGTKTTLENAQLSILGGSLSLKNLEVANPPGYETSQLLDMGECSTTLNLGSLRSDTITIKTIDITKLQLTIEQKGLKSNLQDILDNIKKLQKKEETPEKPEEEKGPTRNLLVEKITITDASARVKLLPIPGKVDVVTIKLAPITLENVSSNGSKGELTVKLIRKILVAVAGGVVQSGAELPPALLKGLAGSVKTLADALQFSAGKLLEGTDAILKTGTEVIKDGGKILEKTGKGVQDILKSTKDLIPIPGKKGNDDKSSNNKKSVSPGNILKQGGKIIEKTGKDLEQIIKAPKNILVNTFDSAKNNEKTKKNNKK